jgi:hypothetical protein
MPAFKYKQRIHFVNLERGHKAAPTEHTTNQAVQSAISDFGSKMQDSSNLKIFIDGPVSRGNDPRYA